MPKHIAIVEDEPAIAENYRDAFAQRGYEVSVYPDRPTALLAFERQLPDLAVIDVGLGDEPEGGFDLCRELRNRSTTLPIVFLTAHTSDYDVISGLNLGADEYLGKETSQAQMMARISKLFRRMEAIRAPAREEDVLTCGDLAINSERMQINWKNQPVDLTVTEFWIVRCLAERPGHVKNRQQLMDAANVVIDDNTMTSHIKRARKKFVALDADFDAIETAYGMGYRWRA
jgi:two-component system OmpR family response regulator